MAAPLAEIMPNQALSQPVVVHLHPTFDLSVSFDLRQAFAALGRNSLQCLPTYLLSVAECGSGTYKVLSLVSLSSGPAAPSPYKKAHPILFQCHPADPYPFIKKLVHDGFYYAVTDSRIHSYLPLWQSLNAPPLLSLSFT